MLKSKQSLSQKGFTIVELLIVIVIIGILAALVLNTFSNAQKRARDTERQTDTKSISTQLEVYYQDKGYYPVMSDITPTNLEGMSEGALVAPQKDETSSLVAAQSASKDDYGYVCLDESGATVATPTEGDCAGFELSYTREDPGDDTDPTVIIKGLNN